MYLRNRQIPSVNYLLPLLLWESNSPLGVITSLRRNSERYLKFLGHSRVVARLFNFFVEIIAIWVAVIIRALLHDDMWLLTWWFPEHFLKIRDYLILGCFRRQHVVILRSIESWTIKNLILPGCMIEIFGVHWIHHGRSKVSFANISSSDYHHRLGIWRNLIFLGTLCFSNYLFGLLLTPILRFL